MGVTNKGEYAVLIMLDLALLLPAQAVTSASEIGARRNLPPTVVPHLVSALRAAGLVETARGPRGGISLSGAAHPERVTVGQILEAVGEKVVIKRCSSAGRSCDRYDVCPLRSTWERVQSAVDRVMGSTTLAKLVEVERLRPGNARTG